MNSLKKISNYLKKWFVILLLIPLGSCAATFHNVYDVGDYKVHITDFREVNTQYRKACKKMIRLKWCNKKVNGFINYKKKEIWSIDRASTIIHEFKHMIEGNFHSTKDEEKFHHE